MAILNKKLPWFLLIILYLLLISCSQSSSGGGNSLGSQYDQHEVSYNIGTTGVTCTNQSYSSTFTSGSYVSKTCIWYCGNYKGQTKIYVSLDFRQSSSGWYLDHEYTSSGLCNR